MSTTLPRRIVVDDTDSAISYGSTGWFVADSTKLNTIGNYGPIYNGTSHTTITNATLSFPFNGTSVSVLGTIAITKDANNVTDPTWDCFVDQIKIENPNPTFQFGENNWMLCDQSQIASGSHELSIQVSSKGQPFYLDQIAYTPLPSVNYDVAVLEYPNTDPAVSFGTGWQPWGVQNVTQQTGAQVALNFHGTAVTLMGYIPAELPHNATSASYTIDGGAPVAFALKGLSAQSPTVYNSVMFTTGTLTPSTHNLVVTYAGDSSKTPLVVGSFYVTNASTTSTPSSTSSTPANSPSSDASTSNVTTKSSSPVGAIVGGILGCLALLALITGLVFWCRRRRRREAENVRRTSANPFMTPAAEAGPVSVAGAQYSYAAVPGESHGHPYAYAQPETHGSPATATSGSVVEYPYIPPGASTASRSHAHTASASSGAFDSSLSDANVAGGAYPHTPSGSGSSGAYDSSANLPTRGANVAGGAYPFPYPTPVPSDGSVRSRKQEQEALASASMSIPSDAPLTPQRRALPRPIVLHRHEDSGVRLQPAPPSPMSEPEIVDLPPGYSRD
ncbi:hypothetical protein C8R47DRAFT_1191175 [Mycena vitilis]|nr:hypothetical protein C8R47DRAFT_1191175 [Mycena vitilis]